MYAKIEIERLLFIRLNQTAAHIYLSDAIPTDINSNKLGKMVILLAAFTRSPQNMHEFKCNDLYSRIRLSRFIYQYYVECH